MGAVDVVYVVRPGENEELRYSLRSLVNFPHRRVFIAGSVPAWARNVIGIALTPLPEKFANQRASLTAAVGDSMLTRTFWLLNDDHFVCESTAGPSFHRGPFSTYRPRTLRGGQNPHSTWWQAVCSTAEWVAETHGIDPLIAETHSPLAFDKGRLRDLLADYPADRQFAAGATWSLTGAVPGEIGLNVKCKTDAEFATKWGVTPYLSSNDESFAHGAVGEYVRSLFPEPCKYEEQ